MSTAVQEDFNAAVRAALKRNGLLVRDLAAHLDLPLKCISNRLSGLPWSEEEVEQVTRFLDLSVRPLPRYMPTEPLLAVVATRGGLAACLKDKPDLDRGHIDRALYRGLSAGRFTVHAADTLAIELLGLHPMLVWGDDWLG